MSIGALIKKYRIKAKYTQKQLAEYLSCHPSFISKWETGKTVPTLTNMENLVLELGHEFNKAIRDIPMYASIAYNPNISTAPTKPKLEQRNTCLAQHIKNLHKASSRSLVNNVLYWITEATKDPRSVECFTGEYVLKAAPFCYWGHASIDPNTGHKDSREVYLDLVDHGFSVSIEGQEAPYTWIISWLNS